MKNLRMKFGKFAISKEEMGKISGGSVTCSSNGGNTTKTFKDSEIDNAVTWCHQRPSCSGCV